MANRAANILGVFAKQPTAGEVKTRLARETSPGWAADVAAAFRNDALHRLAAVRARRVLRYTPESARSFFADLVGDRFELQPQGDGDLGQRLERFFAEHLPGEDCRVVAVGTDSPSVPVEYVSRAFHL